MARLREIRRGVVRVEEHIPLPEYWRTAHRSIPPHAGVCSIYPLPLDSLYCPFQSLPWNLS